MAVPHLSKLEHGINKHLAGELPHLVIAKASDADLPLRITVLLGHCCFGMRRHCVAIRRPDGDVHEAIRMVGPLDDVVECVNLLVSGVGETSLGSPGVILKQYLPILIRAYCFPAPLGACPVGIDPRSPPRAAGDPTEGTPNLTK